MKRFFLFIFVMMIFNHFSHAEAVSENQAKCLVLYYSYSGNTITTNVTLLDGSFLQKIVHEVVQYLGEDGKTLYTERLTDFTRKAIKKQYPTLDAFRGAWAKADKKQAIIDELAENNVLLDAVREENPNLQDCDYFDIICHVAFDQKPLTRKERIEGVKKRNYLAKHEGQARKVIEGLMEKYGEVGVTNIENPQILSLNPFAQIAKRPRIMKGIFKSPEDYNKAVKDLENELYKIG